MPESKIENPRSHSCDEMPVTGVYVQYGSNLPDRPSCWSLYLVREATEQDLEENHYLEEVGDSMWAVWHEISFCPHCGIKLESPDVSDEDISADKETAKAYGASSLFDQEKWYGRLR
jgi:hypothetical protein